MPLMTPADPRAPGPRPSFLHEPWVVVLQMVLVPPLGFWSLARSPEISRAAKATMSLLWVLAVLLWIGMEAETQSAKGELRSFRLKIVKAEILGALSERNYAHAKAKLEELREEDPTLPEVKSLRARLARLEGRTEDEQEALAAFLKDSKGEIDPSKAPGDLVRYGRLCLASNQLDEVEALLEVLTGPEARSLGSSALKAGLSNARGKFQEAEKIARRAVEVFDVDTFGPAYLEIAKSRAGREDWRAATYFGLESARHLDPGLRPAVSGLILGWAEKAGLDLVPVRSFLTTAWLRGPIGSQHRPDKATSEVVKEAYQALAKNHPDFFAGDLVQHAIGTELYYTLEDYEAAADAYQKGAQDYPQGETRCRSRYQYARCMLELERFDEGIRWSRRVAGDCPGGLRGSARGLERRLFRKMHQEEGDEEGSEDEASDSTEPSSSLASGPFEGEG